MYIGKKLKRLLIASVIVNGLLYTPELYFHDVAIKSVAYAEIKEYSGTDTAMLDFGEDNEKIVNTVKSVAKTRAEIAAKEKAGVYIKSYSKSINAILTDDDISVVTNNIIDIVDVKYKKLTYEAHSAKGQSFGKIGIMYEATVTVKIDTDGISNYLNLKDKDKTNLITQNKALQKSIEILTFLFPMI